MDILSQVLEAVQVRSPLISDLRLGHGVTLDMLENVGTPFHYILSGEVELLIEDRIVPLHAGDFAILPNWPRYAIRTGDGLIRNTIIELVEGRNLPLWSERDGLNQPIKLDFGPQPQATTVISGNFVLDTERARFLTRSLPDIIAFRSAELDLHSSLKAASSWMLQELDNPVPGFAAVASRTLELLFVQALRSWILRSDKDPGWGRGLAQPNVRRALEAVYADPGALWTLDKLAKVAGQSRSAFAAVFRETLGESPFIHLRRFRMHMAADRLAGTRQSVPMIAESLGYESAHAFARAFVAELGLTPSAYRRERRAATAMQDALDEA